MTCTCGHSFTEHCGPSRAVECSVLGCSCVGFTEPAPAAAAPAMVRPPWESMNPTGYVPCTCGSILQSREQLREHWQRGHFDALAARAECSAQLLKLLKPDQLAMDETQRQIVSVLVLRLRAMDEWEVEAAIEAMDVVARELAELTTRTRQRIGRPR